MQEELLKIMDKFYTENNTSVFIPKNLINDLSKYEKVYLMKKSRLEFDHYGRINYITNNLRSNTNNRVYKTKKKKRNKLQ